MIPRDRESPRSGHVITKNSNLATRWSRDHQILFTSDIRGPGHVTVQLSY